MMLRAVSLLITLCTVIFLCIFSAASVSKPIREKIKTGSIEPMVGKKNSNHKEFFKSAVQDTTKTNKKPIKVPSLPKIPAKSAVNKLVETLIKPFRFNYNEKIRVTKIIHDYIVSDSIANTANIKSLSANLALTTQQLNQLKVTLDSLKKHPLNDTLVLVFKKNDTGKPNRKGKDSTASDTDKQSATPGSQLFDNADNAVKLAALSSLAPFYKKPLRIIYDTVKDSGLVKTKQLKIGYKKDKKIFGFVAGQANSNFHVNFNLITSIVYPVDLNTVYTNSAEIDSNTAIIDSARKAGKDVFLSVYNNSGKNNEVYNISKFLKSNNSQKKIFIENAVKLLTKIKAKGISINFTGLYGPLNSYFVTFIDSLHSTLQKKCEKCEIIIDLPADDKNVAYDLSALDRFTKYFIIDFTIAPDTPGPFAPINDGSENSVETCFSFYTNLVPNIDLSKFIMAVPYRGGVWQNKPEKFLHYIAYKTVRKNFEDATVIYNQGKSAANIQIDSASIWYDDQNTLGEKYDYVMRLNIAGIAIKYLGDDNGYGELQDEIAYKFLKIDTAFVSKQSIGPTWQEFINLLIINPCQQLVNPVYRKILGELFICTSLVLVATFLFRFFQIKKKGSDWNLKSLITNILIGVFGCWIMMLLLCLFFNNNIPWFGFSLQGNASCINMPFYKVFIILAGGVIVGVISRWIYQLNHNDDKP